MGQKFPGVFIAGEAPLGVPAHEKAGFREFLDEAVYEPAVVVVARRILRTVGAEFSETKRFRQGEDLVVALDMLLINEIGVGVEALNVHVSGAGVVIGGMLTMVRAIDPNQ